MERKVCLGMIVAAHGIRGEVKVKSFTESPRAITSYGPLTDRSGRVLKLRLRGAPKGEMLIAAVDGVTDRNAAEALRNTELFVPRRMLPRAEAGEYYHADLVGLAAETLEGALLGRVVAVRNFGAGDMLEIEPAGAQGGSRDTVMVPFTDPAVPEVDVDAGRLRIDPAFWLEATAADTAERGMEDGSGMGDGAGA